MIRIEESNAAYAPGFDDPIGLLEACHARISGHCVTLERLRDHLRQSGADAAARTAAERILHYFDTAGAWHHQDEEQDLQPLLEPLLRERGDEATLGRLRALMAEHGTLSAAYRPLRAALAAIVAGSYAGELPIEPYVSVMRRHFTEENELLFPRSRALFDDKALRTLGTAMARRRGVQFGGSS
ncbi:MAG: hemerythrin domain-containing protein [Gammaproteobacteria bacterium]|nr:hemerythrin domain-containing protein [Gammaproteobacteria bacterium]